MAKPTLTQVFGAGASQTISQLVISKADLNGLTATTTNTAESLLAGIVLEAEGVLTPAAQATNPDQSITVVRGTPALTTEFDSATGNPTQYKETPFTITLRKIYTDSAININDY